MQEKSNDTGFTYVQKVWIAASILALVFVLLWLFKALFNVLLMLLAGVLIACFFQGLAQLIQRKTKWPSWLCLTISVAGSLILIVLLFWFIGAKVQAQVSQLSETLPATIDKAKQELSQSAFGQKLLNEATSTQSQNKLKQVASQFFRSTFGFLGDTYVILFIGIFLTAKPSVYKKGIIRLVPPQGRDKASEVLDQVGLKLTKWLKGKLFAMLVVFILTLAGLMIMGVPMALALALLAGILNFIPNFGPLIALVPAVLVGLMQGSTTALLVACLYIFVQVLESNFITPMVQQKLVSIPPAVIIVAQLVMGTLAGFLGILLATPFILIVMVLVNTLYIKRLEATG